MAATREDMEKWKAEGRAEGMAETQVKSVITVLTTRFREIPATFHNKLPKIRKIRSKEHFETVLKQATMCQSLKEFQKALYPRKKAKKSRGQC